MIPYYKQTVYITFCYVIWLKKNMLWDNRSMGPREKKFCKGNRAEGVTNFLVYERVRYIPIRIYEYTTYSCWGTTKIKFATLTLSYIVSEIGFYLHTEGLPEVWLRNVPTCVHTAETTIRRIENGERTVKYYLRLSEFMYLFRKIWKRSMEWKFAIKAIARYSITLIDSINWVKHLDLMVVSF